MGKKEKKNWIDNVRLSVIGCRYEPRIKIGVEGRPRRVNRGRLENSWPLHHYITYDYEYFHVLELVQGFLAILFSLRLSTKRVTNEHVNVPGRGSSIPLAKTNWPAIFLRNGLQNVPTKP